MYTLPPVHYLLRFSVLNVVEFCAILYDQRLHFSGFCRIFFLDKWVHLQDFEKNDEIRPLLNFLTALRYLRCRQQNCSLFHFGKFVCLSFRKCVLGKRIVYSRFSFHFLWYQALVLCILLCLNCIHTYVHVHHVCMLVFYIVRFVISTEFYNIRYLVNRTNTWGNRALLQILYTI